MYSMTPAFLYAASSLRRILLLPSLWGESYCRLLSEENLAVASSLRRILLLSLSEENLMLPPLRGESYCCPFSRENSFLRRILLLPSVWGEPYCCLFSEENLTVASSLRRRNFDNSCSRFITDHSHNIPTAREQNERLGCSMCFICCAVISDIW
jgi:hypothetical protein